METTINVSQIVDQLMIKESQQLAKYQKIQDTSKVTVSNYGDFKSVVDNFKKSVDGVKNSFDATAYQVSVSDPLILQATMTNSSSVYAATHKLNIAKLAQPETLAAVIPFSEKSTALNLTGDLKFTVGTEDFTVYLSASDSLDKIRDKINSSSSNKNVSANIISSNNDGAAEYTLVISSKKTGLDNKVTISGSSASVFDFSNELSEAKDAEFTFDGKSVVRDTNNISDVIDGLSFNLLKTGLSDLVVSDNTGSQQKNVSDAIHGMVDSYNKVIDFIDGVTIAKTLTDGNVGMIKSKLKSEFTKTVDSLGSVTSLLDLGITLAKSKQIPIPKKDGDKSTYNLSYTSTGKYNIDDKKLQKILGDNLSDVKQFFNDDTSGLIKRVDNAVNLITQYGGIIESRQKAINENLLRIGRLIGDEESRLADTKSALIAKYTHLNTLLDKSDKMTNFLTMQYSKKS